MSKNAMTDTVNLRRLASELRKQEHRAVPDARTLLALSRKLGIYAWTTDMIRKNAEMFADMLEFHMMEFAEPGED